MYTPGVLHILTHDMGWMLSPSDAQASQAVWPASRCSGTPERFLRIRHTNLLENPLRDFGRTPAQPSPFLRRTLCNLSR